MILGIDATNIRAGGGVTHLVELLRYAEPGRHGFVRVVVWGSVKILEQLDEAVWLEKRSPRDLERGLLRRLLWQKAWLSQAAKEEGCDLLFVPGGTYFGTFTSVVTMSQNLLPFDFMELRRYGFSLKTLRLLLLRVSQTQAFRNSAGVIFLSEYARNQTIKVTGQLSGQTTVIPHGISSNFQIPPRTQYPISKYSAEKPFRILYVSIIDYYKHQWNVVEAVAALRSAGLPVVLDLVGPAFPPALVRLKACLDKFDGGNNWTQYHGARTYNELPAVYSRADIGVWASSCETFGLILLEYMAAGLPVACSNLGPMREIIGDGGSYFDPNNPLEIAQSLRALIDSKELREEKANAGYLKAKEYSWSRCARLTFSFLEAAATTSTNSVSPGVEFHDALASGWGAGYAQGGFRKRFIKFNEIFDRTVVSGQDWLDLGCGSGVLSAELIRRGVTVVAVDASRAMLDLSKQNVISEHISFQIGDAQDLSWLKPRTFDGVLCSSVVEYLEDPIECVRHICNLLGENAVLIISIPAKQSFVRSLQKGLRRMFNLLGMRKFEYLKVSQFELRLSDAADWFERAGLHIGRIETFDPILPRCAHKILRPSLYIYEVKKIVR
jgi:glycosyltransferase involved in cell wall biosynthesis/SAM-dependent methyltransferase